MKKIFTLMTFVGVLLALITAGGADAGSLTTKRIFLQALLSALMVLCGAYFMRRGDVA